MIVEKMLNVIANAKNAGILGIMLVGISEFYRLLRMPLDVFIIFIKLVDMLFIKFEHERSSSIVEFIFKMFVLKNNI